MADVQDIKRPITDEETRKRLLTGSEMDQMVDKILDNELKAPLLSEKDLGTLLETIDEPEPCELEYIDEVIKQAEDSEIVGKFKDMDFKVQIGYSLFSDMIGLLKEHRSLLENKATGSKDEK